MPEQEQKPGSNIQITKKVGIKLMSSLDITLNLYNQKALNDFNNMKNTATGDAAKGGE
jgi:hypothetical protein